MQALAGTRGFLDVDDAATAVALATLRDDGAAPSAGRRRIERCAGSRAA